MTGHGDARVERNGVSVTLEIRTINSRYLKLTVRAGEGYASLESRIEAVLRQRVRRGTVQVNVVVGRASSADDYRLNSDVLAGYREQLETLCDRLHLQDSVHIESLLTLPGVVAERLSAPDHAEEDWPLVEEALEQALTNLEQMRLQEGKAMQHDLLANCDVILNELDQVAQRAPAVAEAYQTRLTERLNKLLADFGTRIEAADVVREVGVYAERCDIAEEMVRLRSHIDQFKNIVAAPDASGRKLDFLTQEMFRETNTIGAKANDAEIARHVVEIKASIERIREMVQNVE